MHVLRLRWLASILLPLLFITSAVVAPVSSVSANAAYQTNPASEINRTLAEISRAERAENWHGLYDLMLPDARMLISRTAFVNWWPTVAEAAPADVLKIGNLEFADITYELTGTDYGNVAFASYSYHDVNGNEVEREIQLAEVGGVWRWMPQIERTEVDDINAMGGYTVTFTSAFSSEIYQELDTFWAQIFSDLEMEYRSPVDMIGVRVDGTPTGCGAIDDVDEVFAQYCPRDETIYFNPDAREGIIAQHGQGVWEMIMAHEWAHHIQNISGMYVSKSPELLGGNYSIEHELQADCLSGIFMQDSIVIGIFDSRTVREIDAFVQDMGGDARGTTWDDIRAHGSAEQRIESFHTGFDDGLRGCYFGPN